MNRLNREQNNLRMHFIYLTASIIILLFLFSGCNHENDFKTINVQQINLVDSLGNIRAQLKVSEDGPGLFILDEQGRERAVIIYQKDQTGFFALDTNGHPRVGAAHFAHGGSGFALHGKDLKGAAVLYMNSKSEGSLSIIDTAGKTIERMPDQ